MPELAPPGAGLPWLELQIGRLIFYSSYRRTTPEKTDILLNDELATLVSLAKSIPPADAARPVLIPRLRGMEDSSRNWSVFMTLEHIAIVNEVIGGVISSLTHGAMPARKASTADVKPGPGADASALDRCIASTALVRTAGRAATNHNHQLRFAHPWFGPLDAAQWHFMAAFHQRLHRRQIETILSGLARK